MKLSLRVHVKFSRHITRGPRWRTLRMAILERDGFRCVQCGARGRLEVDHVKPVRTHPALAWEPSNLQVLCPRCHGAKTRTEVNLPQPDPRREAWNELLRNMQRETKSSLGERNA